MYTSLYTFDIDKTRPPQLRCELFPSIYLPYIHHMIEVAIGLQLLLQPYPHVLPLIWFLFVRPEVCLELPSDSISLWTPLFSAICLPLQGRIRDFHPLEFAHAGRTKKLLDLCRQGAFLFVTSFLVQLHRVIVMHLQL